MALNRLPNVSTALGEDLIRIGISSPEELASLGAEEAWTRLRAAGLRYSVHRLLALEGALQGIGWDQLSATRRFELIRFAARVLEETEGEDAKPFDGTGGLSFA